MWIIDPAKDDAIIEVRGYVVKPDGTRTLLDRTTNDYSRRDGRWWLKRTEYKSEKRGTLETNVFHQAEFDRKEHPKVINVDVLCLPAGVKVADFRDPPPQRSGRPKYYAGAGQIVTEQEWNTMKDRIDLGPLHEFERDQLAYGNGLYPSWWQADAETLGLEGVERNPHLWEAYVRRWILRYSAASAGPVGSTESKTTKPLSQSQVESAWTVYRDSIRRVEPHVRRMAGMPGVALSLDTLPGENKSDDGIRPQTSTGNDGTRRTTTAPAGKPEPTRTEREVAELFERLKQRLNRLLQTEQDIEKAGAAKARE